MFEDDESTVMVPTFAPGSFFADRYRIDQLLGTGGMGRVYAATEIHSDRRVALKVLHGERLAEAETVARFKREAEVLASIGHPCIVEIYAFHETMGMPFLAMELLEGVTLKTRLHNAGRFEDPVDLQGIVDCIASALEVAHDAEVIHRDLKPDNIFLPATGSPRAKLVDFGLSRVAKQDKSLTTSGMIIGTPRYMAPEQIKNASATGPASDIYSFGVIVYECLTGQSPYPAQDYGQLLGCLLEGRTTPFAQLRPDLPGLVPFTQRALAPDPAARYQSAGELADAYAQAIGRKSQRDAILAQTKRPPKRKRSKSLAGMVPSRASTLAWDASAARDALKELEKGPPPGMTVDPEALDARKELGFARTPDAGIPKPSWEQSAPVRLHFDEASATDPMRPEQLGFGGPPAAPRPVSSPPPPMASSYTPAPATPAPVTPAPVPLAEPPRVPSYSPAPQASYATPASSPPPPMQASPIAPAMEVKAQGGDTLYLGDANAALPFVAQARAQALAQGAQAPQPQAPQPHAAYPQAPRSQAPQAFSQAASHAPPKKKGGLGVVLFLVALLVVVVLSALGGFALRAHLRGELEIPGTSQ
ncbi:MAG: serine/threonine protein kinase [Sandaracinaceae bacterium]|nr:serine/threonine protein kinase [Sandaracinaceae bacterium]